MKMDSLSIDVENDDDVTLTWRDDKSLEITIGQEYGRRVDLWFPTEQAEKVLAQIAERRPAPPAGFRVR